MKVKRFDPAIDTEAWNRFVQQGKNSTFLFQREFMDYHADRFQDHSLMIFNEKGQLVSLMPANITNEREVISHQGLTYGGFVLQPECKLETTIAVIYQALCFLKEQNIRVLKLKLFPGFYNSDATDEIEYILFLLNAVLYRRDVAFAINQKHRILYTGNIRREAAKAEKQGAKVVANASTDEFWEQLLVPGLNSRFGVSPVHTAAEIKKLQNAFPQNIRQYNCYMDGELVAGTTLFVTAQVAHCQYISSNEKGRKSGALNYLFKHLLDEVYADIPIFDFGIVNEKEGREINTGMLFWKEGFGGRARKHDFYQIDTTTYTLLEPFVEERL